LRHQSYRQGPEGKAADMGEECDPAAKLWMKNGEAAFPELKDEPDAEEYPRR
jgi:hypothetical protein